jgi:hypothetical protein
MTDYAHEILKNLFVKGRIYEDLNVTSIDITRIVSLAEFASFSCHK